MDIKEVIENIDNRVQCAMVEYNRTPEDDAYDEESLAIAIEAMKKQVPMKPERIMKTMSMCLTKEECGTAYTCDCGAYVGYLHKYCNDCGQKLDWED